MKDCKIAPQLCNDFNYASKQTIHTQCEGKISNKSVNRNVQSDYIPLVGRKYNEFKPVCYGGGVFRSYRKY